MSLRDKIDGNELDLSLNQLEEVPVKELANTKKATHLDLSCNHLTILPSNFAILTHLVKIDLSKNRLTELPQNFGNLVNLHYLDLYGNSLTSLPLSFCRLKNLRWLDLKNNPLDKELNAVAGDCLDEKQCQSCAKKVVAFMQAIESDIERVKQKTLKLEREKEAFRRAREEKELEEQRKVKKAEKERRKAESRARREEEQRRLQLEDRRMEENNGKSASTTLRPNRNVQTEKGYSWSTVFVFFILAPLLVAAGVVAFGAFRGRNLGDISAIQIQTFILESTRELQDITATWWSAFLVPYTHSVKTNVLEWVHYALIQVSEFTSNFKGLSIFA